MRMTARAAGAARPRTPGRHGGEPERADRGAAPRIDRSQCAEPKSVSLIRELIAALVTSWWGDGYATIGR